MSSWVSGILHGMNYAVKGIQLFFTAKDIKDTVEDDDLSTTQKIMRVGADSVFIVAQSAEMGASIKTGCSKKVKFGTRCAAGAADVTRQVAQKGFGWDTLATAAFRAADVTDGAVDYGFIGKGKKLGHSVDALNAGSTLIANRALLIDSAKGGFTCTKKIVQGIRQQLKGKPKITGEKNSKESAGYAQDHTNHLKEQVVILMKMADWKNLREIPIEYKADPVLSNFICFLTDRPARHVMTLDDPSEEAPICYFEREALESWLQDDPNSLPPHWPEALFPRPIKAEYFRVCRHSQRIIDTRLQFLSEDAQREVERLYKDFPDLRKLD